MQLLASYKSYWAAMNKIFIYPCPCVNKITWTFFVHCYFVVKEFAHAFSHFSTQKARVKAKATLTHFLCSPSFPRASITGYTHAKHEQILKWLRLAPLFQSYIVHSSKFTNHRINHND